jgi:hypothetical protein
MYNERILMQGFPGQPEGERGRGVELHPLNQPHQLQEQEGRGPSPQGDI